MKYVHKGLLGLILASMGAAASAGLHHICYEDQFDIKRDVTRIVVGCANDSGQPCGVRVLQAPSSMGGGVLVGNHPRITSPGTFYTYEIPGNAALTLRFAVDFAVKRIQVVRECTVRTTGRPDRDGGAVGTLTGFSNDTTGWVSTGVWRHVQDGRSAVPKVPHDFMAVGGGIETEPGTFAQRLRPQWLKGELRDWSERSFGELFGSGNPPNDFPSAKVSVGYAIGLRIGDLTRDDLVMQSVGNLTPPIVLTPSTSSATLGTTSTGRESPPQPGADVVVGADFLALSSGVSIAQAGHFATVHEPSEGLQRLICLIAQSPTCPVPVAESWRVQSRGLRGVMGRVSSQLMVVPSGTVFKLGGGAWELRGKLVKARSAFGFAPGVDVAGLRGEYAVVAVGGSSDSRVFNSNPFSTESFLTRVEPRLDLGGARVEARHGQNPVMARVSASALGLKLVPVGWPADEVPNAKPDEPVEIDWICSLSDALAETAMCRNIGKTIPASQLCDAFGDELRQVGVCLKP